MNDIVMVGSGGCMRELAWQILEDNKKINKWNIIGYVDNIPPSDSCGLNIGNYHIPYLGDDNYLLKADHNINVVISIGNSQVRAKVASKYLTNKNLHFPCIVLDNACVCEDSRMGQGCIVAMDARISTNTKMGEFVFMNTGSILCHDSEVGDYVTFSPRSQVAGMVTIGDKTEIGMNATVIQCLKIGSNVIIGAGATVIREVENNCTVVGVPARKVVS